MEYRIAPKKKVKTRSYSILIQKSKGSSAFDKQKVKNIDYNRYFPTLGATASLGWYCIINLAVMALENTTLQATTVSLCYKLENYLACVISSASQLVCSGLLKLFCMILLRCLKENFSQKRLTRYCTLWDMSIFERATVVPVRYALVPMSNDHFSLRSPMPSSSPITGLLYSDKNFYGRLHVLDVTGSLQAI